MKENSKLIKILPYFFMALLNAAIGDSLQRNVLYVLICATGAANSILIDKINGIEKLIAAMNSLIFNAAYTVKYLAYTVLVRSELNLDLKGAREALFPPWSLSIIDSGVTESLYIVFAGVCGLLISTVLIVFYGGGQLRIVKNVRIDVNRLVWFGIALYVLTTVGRLALGLRMGEESSELPSGVGGVITITSSYLVPNIILYAATYLLINDQVDDAKKIFYVVLTMSVFQYLIFYTKGSMLMPLFWIIVAQIAIKKLFEAKFYIILFSGLILLYPFLNIYRWVSMSGSSSLSQVIYASSMMLEENQTGGAVEVFLLGLFSLWGRIVGFDSLLALVNNGDGIKLGILEYMFSNIDLDDYLTYNIIGFTTPMGVSPGNLGRLHMIWGEWFFVMLMVALTVFFSTSVVSFLRNKASDELRPFSVILVFYIFQLSLSGFKLIVFNWWLFSTVAIYMIAINLSNKIK